MFRWEIVLSNWKTMGRKESKKKRTFKSNVSFNKIEYNWKIICMLKEWCCCDTNSIKGTNTVLCMSISRIVAFEWRQFERSNISNVHLNVCQGQLYSLRWKGYPANYLANTQSILSGRERSASAIPLFFCIFI